MEFQRPTELADFFSYLLAYAPENYPQEFGRYTNADAFGDAFRAMQKFRESAKSAEGIERINETDRHLHLAYEYYEKGDSITGSRCLQEVMELFRKCRRFIRVSDE